jgi:hypothetical protein
MKKKLLSLGALGLSISMLLSGCGGTYHSHRAVHYVPHTPFVSHSHHVVHHVFHHTVVHHTTTHVIHHYSRPRTSSFRVRTRSRH